MRPAPIMATRTISFGATVILLSGLHASYPPSTVAGMVPRGRHHTTGTKATTPAGATTEEAYRVSAVAESASGRQRAAARGLAQRLISASSKTAARIQALSWWPLR
jgi:hypothetical protein